MITDWTKYYCNTFDFGLCEWLVPIFWIKLEFRWRGYGDDSRGATLLKLKSEMLLCSWNLREFLGLLWGLFHIISKIVERAFQQHSIRTFSNSNEGDMSVAKSVRRKTANCDNFDELCYFYDYLCYFLFCKP